MHCVARYGRVESAAAAAAASESERRGPDRVGALRQKRRGQCEGRPALAGRGPLCRMPAGSSGRRCVLRRSSRPAKVTFVRTGVKKGLTRKGREMVYGEALAVRTCEERRRAEERMVGGEGEFRCTTGSMPCLLPYYRAVHVLPETRDDPLSGVVETECAQRCRGRCERHDHHLHAATKPIRPMLCARMRARASPAPVLWC